MHIDVCTCIEHFPNHARSINECILVVNAVIMITKLVEDTFTYYIGIPYRI